MLTVTDADFLWFVDLALDAMVSIVDDLGDEAASARPDLEEANSPYAILTHCLGVMEYWGGAMVAGRTIVRDRAAEFRAQGAVAELVVRVTAARRRLEDDMADMDAAAAPRRPEQLDADRPYGRTQGGVLLHILEELFQHLGQMEISLDLLRRDG